MVINQRILKIERGDPFTVFVNGEAVEAYAGETITAVLLSANKRVFRKTSKSGSPRGFFCGMGICYDCLVTVDGVANIRSCMQTVSEGCVIEVAAL
ncbi:MAG: (2Fe-2S)-binding protein [Chloroflexi bacterium]|nr:(2Fe-2S)-binding protein [Chloroflexota bacterium]